MRRLAITVPESRIPYWNKDSFGAFEKPIQVDVAGGIHDSAGYEKHSWAANTATIFALMLTEFDVYDEWDQATHDESVQPNRVIPLVPDGRPDLPQLVRWMNDWLLRMKFKNVFPDHPMSEMYMEHIFNEMHFGFHTNRMAPGYHTDNDPSTLEDNRLVLNRQDVGRCMKFSLTGAQALATGARAFLEEGASYRDEAIAQEYMEEAIATWRNCLEYDEDGKGPVQDRESKISFSFNAAVAIYLTYLAKPDLPAFSSAKPGTEAYDVAGDPEHYLSYLLRTGMNEKVKVKFGTDYAASSVNHTAAMFMKYVNVAQHPDHTQAINALKAKFTGQFKTALKEARRKAAANSLRIYDDLGISGNGYGASFAMTNKIMDLWTISVALDDESILDVALPYLDFILGKTPMFDYCWVVGLGSKYPPFASNAAYAVAQDKHPEGLLGVLIPGVYAFRTKNDPTNLVVDFRERIRMQHVETFEKFTCRYLFATAIWAKAPTPVERLNSFAGFPGKAVHSPKWVPVAGELSKDEGVVRLRPGKDGAPAFAFAEESHSYGHTISANLQAKGEGAYGIAFCRREGPVRNWGGVGTYFAQYDSVGKQYQIGFISKEDGKKTILKSCAADDPDGALEIAVGVGCSRADMYVDGRRALWCFYGKSLRPTNSPSGGECGVISEGAEIAIENFTAAPGMEWESIPGKREVVR